MDSQQALEWAAKAFTTFKQSEYEKLDRYLRGDHPLEFATPKFASAFGRAFESFSYNRMPLVVDALADRMQVTGFGANNETISQRAQDIWDQNGMDVQEGVTEREQFSQGDAYLIIEVDPDTGDVLMWPQRANQSRVLYSNERPGTIVCGVKRWKDATGYGRLTIYFPDRIEKYRSTSQSLAIVGQPAEANQVGAADWIGTSWEPYTPDGEEWPLPLAITDTVPMFHFANNAGIDNRGISELHDVIAIQDALNKSLMDLLVAMEFAAYPQRVIVNVDDTREETQEAIQKFVAGVDRLLTLYGTSDAPVQFGEFAAANISQYTDVVEMFDTFISRVSKVPVHYLKMAGDFPSGEALRMAEAPFISKVEDRQRANGAVWADAMRYAVRLSGMEVEPGALRVNWQSAAPLSDEEKYVRADVVR